MGALETRALVAQRLRQDLIGPFAVDEVLPGRPLDIYLSGILWPLESSVEAEEDDGGAGDEEDDHLGGQVSVFGQMKPSTMGLSFAFKVSPTANFKVKYSFGAYSLLEGQNPEEPNSESWKRHDVSGQLEVVLGDDSNQYHDLVTDDLPLNVKLNIRNKILNNLRLITITLINASRVIDQAKVDGNIKSIFQTHLSVERQNDSAFMGLPDERMPIDEDEESARLLYWDEHSFAVGHQCSATWSDKEKDVSKIETEWLPTESVPMFSQAGHEVFEKLFKSGNLEARALASQEQAIIFKTLRELSKCYETWIINQEAQISGLPFNLVGTAERHIQNCKSVNDRINQGIDLLESSPEALQAFRVANLAMSTQHSWKFEDNDARQRLIWRPFQIAFILLTIESVVNPSSPEREVLDLLWFPTGGGKTEAYLAIIAFGAVFQRLKTKNALSSYGNFAVMRYTLRLLTAQQFERASALILALELIRKGLIDFKFKVQCGDTPFSIGLWVGGDATPNSYDDAKSQRGADYGASAEQIIKCFKCGKKLKWIYSDKAREVRPTCTDEGCDLGPRLGVWPISTVDEDIYRIRPTLLIGTVDKFAQLPRREEMKHLFGFKSKNATELIIQDELHLISGPLGTIVGAYELAFDWLLSVNGLRPKVIGSTATIRRAESQVRALFDRQSCQFPPPGLSYKDSGYAVIDYEKPGRLYVGLSNAGRSAKFTLQAVAASLLQSGGLEKLGDVKSRDGYSTLLMYFNNLRELGGAIVQVLDDVPDSILLYARRRGEDARNLDAPKELTSTRSQTEILEILADLAKSCDSKEKVDVVLATNMVSVGVDVPRLGLMQVNGQPKTRSEYIQSTSRVGRSDYPGLVVVSHNILRARDRSHFETFTSWHRRLYRDVEATSVTPFASRSRDRTLRTLIASMVRHGDPKMFNTPNLSKASPSVLQEIVLEVQRRVNAIDPDVAKDVAEEVKSIFDEWIGRDVEKYLDESPKGIRKSLLQGAERFAQKIAVGVLPGYAWPVMNAMRSVEPSTPFRLKERRSVELKQKIGVEEVVQEDENKGEELPPWRQI